MLPSWGPTPASNLLPKGTPKLLQVKWLQTISHLKSFWEGFRLTAQGRAGAAWLREACGAIGAMTVQWGL